MELVEIRNRMRESERPAAVEPMRCGPAPTLGRQTYAHPFTNWTKLGRQRRPLPSPTCGDCP